MIAWEKFSTFAQVQQEKNTSESGRVSPCLYFSSSSQIPLRA